MEWSDVEKMNGRMILGHYGEGGHHPGSFSESLIRCFETADLMNTQRLFEAFPEWTRPITLMKFNGIKALREKVES